MNIAILGATGGTGLELVRRCLESGHSVTAFARKPDSLMKFRGRIKVVTGNLLNACELTTVLHGHDAVLSGFGPRVPIATTDAHLLRDFATTLITSMKQASLRRARRNKDRRANCARRSSRLLAQKPSARETSPE